MSKRPNKPQPRPPKKPSGTSFATLGLVAVAAIVLVGAVVFLQNRTISTPAPALPAETQMAVGPANAPVVVEEFLDFQCPTCRAVSGSVVHKLEADAVAPGSNFKLVFRTLSFIGAESVRMAEAAVCASGQGKFVPYQDRLFAEQRAQENSGYMTRERLLGYASDLGLDQAKFTSCLDNEASKPALLDADKRANALGVKGTPTFVINGKVNTGSYAYDNIKRLIADAAKAGGQP